MQGEGCAALLSFDFVPLLEGDAFEAPITSLADTLDLGIVHKEIVNQPAVVAVQRLKLDSMTGNPDPLRLLFHLLQQTVLTHGAEELAIHPHTWRTGLATLQDSIGQVLDVIQDLATTTDESIMIFRMNLEGRAIRAILFVDTDNKTEEPKKGVQDCAGVFKWRHGWIQ